MNREEAIKILKGIKEEAGAYEESVCYVGADEDIEAFNMAIEALQINIVRCKDCKHRDEKCGMGEHRWCKILKMSTVPNDFCSYGERREIGG